MKTLNCAGVLPLLLIALSAAAPQAPDASPIVVQGNRERDTQIKEFVKDLTRAPIRGQLARFEDAVCPVVLGIDDKQAAFVQDRIRRVAKEAGLAVAKGSCQPNLALFIPRSKSALISELERWPFMFPEDWSKEQIDNLKRDPSPVAVWHARTELYSDGMRVTQTDRKDWDTGDDPGGDHLRFGHAVATRLRASARPVYSKSVVIIEAGALTGITPIELADYTIMRSLISSDPRDLAGGPSTILTLLDTPLGALVPQSITPWDMSFLRSFYASSKNMFVEYQRAQIKGQMRRQLAKEQASQQ